MKSGTRKTGTRLAALLLGVAMLPACAAERKGIPEAGMSFKDYDSNKDGFLSLEEFKARGKDNLAFNAADINGDGRVDPGEFDKYLARKASDQPNSGPEAGQAKPAHPPAAY